MNNKQFREQSARLEEALRAAVKCRNSFVPYHLNDLEGPISTDGDLETCLLELKDVISDLDIAEEWHHRLVASSIRLKNEIGDYPCVHDYAASYVKKTLEGFFPPEDDMEPIAHSGGVAPGLIGTRQHRGLCQTRHDDVHSYWGSHSIARMLADLVRERVEAIENCNGEDEMTSTAGRSAGRPRCAEELCVLVAERWSEHLQSDGKRTCRRFVLALVDAFDRQPPETEAEKTLYGIVDGANSSDIVMGHAETEINTIKRRQAYKNRINELSSG